MTITEERPVAPSPLRYGVHDVLPALRQVVAEFGPDYVYPNELCQYAVDGQPSCLVGHVLARLGLLTSLTATLTHPADSPTAAVLYFYLPLTPASCEVLDAAQRVQDGCWGPDRRGTWGAALAAAEAAVMQSR